MSLTTWFTSVFLFLHCSHLRILWRCNKDSKRKSQGPFTLRIERLRAMQSWNIQTPKINWALLKANTLLPNSEAILWVSWTPTAQGLCNMAQDGAEAMLELYLSKWTLWTSAPFPAYLFGLVRVPGSPCLVHPGMFPVTFGHTECTASSTASCLARFMPPLAASKNLNHALDKLCRISPWGEKFKWKVQLKSFEMTFTLL